MKELVDLKNNSIDFIKSNYTKYNIIMWFVTILQYSLLLMGHHLLSITD